MSQGRTLSRRAFLQGLAAGVVVGGVGVGGTLTTLRMAEPVYWKMPERWDLEADVVIAGFAVAGASAAIEAAENKASVLVLDKSPTPGGNSVMSGGNMAVINSSAQRERNLVMEVAVWNRSVTRVMKETHWEQVFPTERDMKYMENCGKEVGDWLRNLGIEYELVTPTLIRNKGGGPGLTSVLQKAARERGARVETEFKVTQLVARPDNNMVLGVVGEKGGNRLFVKARRAVVLATGPFSANKDLLKLYSPIGYHALPITAAVSTGEGLLMAQALGAAVANLYHISGFPAIPKVNARFRPQGISAIFVNEKGYRFVSEAEHFEVLNDRIFYQPGQHAWLITDSEQLKKSTGKGISTALSEDLAKEVEQGIVIRAPTLEALADSIKVHKENFLRTVRTWNEWAKTIKRDPDFGRTDSPTFTFSPIENPPFYAVELVPSISGTNGGLVADGESRVINVHGKPIPRLYAAGDIVAGGMISHLGEAIFFGRIAGRNAAREQPWA